MKGMRIYESALLPHMSLVSSITSPFAGLGGVPVGTMRKRGGASIGRPASANFAEGMVETEQELLEILAM